MTSFEARIARIEQKNRGRMTNPVSMIERTRPQQVRRQGPSISTAIVSLPIGAALGAAAVVFGGVVQVAILDGGFTSATEIPPQLGPVAFGIAFVLSFLFDKIVRAGFIGPIAVTIGFVAMMMGEWRVAEEYPEMWVAIYQAEYLDPVLAAAGLAEPELVASVGPEAGATPVPVAGASGAALAEDTK